MSIAKSWKGFRELHQLGWIDQLPKMSGVQAAACDPIVRSWLARATTVAPIEKNPTVAGALAGAARCLLLSLTGFPPLGCLTQPFVFFSEKIDRNQCTTQLGY
jgi:hypothetical protein